MSRVSSNLTLFFALFVPTMWVVFFTSFTIAIFVADDTELPFLTNPAFKFPFLGLYLLFAFLIYKSFFKLRRVEFGGDKYIVSNYFVSYQYIFEDIESITSVPLGRLSIKTIKLRSKSSLGSKIYFLASNNLYQLFLKENPNHIIHSIQGK